MKSSPNRFITYTACTVALCLPLGFGGVAHADRDTPQRESDGQTAPQPRNIIQMRMSGIPSSLLAQQSQVQVVMPRKEDAIHIALQAAKEAAVRLIDTEFHSAA